MRALSLLILVTAAAFAGCSTQQARCEYDKSFDFSNLKTFDWQQSAKQPAKDELLLASVKAAVQNELAAMGITREPQNPDCLVGIGFTTALVRSEDWRNRYTPYYPDRAVFPDYMSEQGRLTLVFLQPHTSKLIWQRWTQFETEPIRLPLEQDAMAQAAVRKILRHFPPTG